MKINFLICGAQKSGTSALDAYLREHPQICMANQKEVHFFDNESFFSDTKPDYSIYHSFFSPSKSTQLIGESTPIYMYWNDAPRRIWEYNPEMKIIIILRNPIERAYSHWNMEVSRNNESLSFFDAISNEMTRTREALPEQHRIYSYIDRGFYCHQLRRLWAFFSKEQVLILKHEDLKNSPQEILNRTTDFLTVSRLHNIQEKNIHSLQYHSKIEARSRELLTKTYHHEIVQLEDLLGWDCSDWVTF